MDSSSANPSPTSGSPTAKWDKRYASSGLVWSAEPLRVERWTSLPERAGWRCGSPPRAGR